MDKELPDPTSLPEVITPESNLPSALPEFPQPEYDQNTSDREIKAIDILQNKFNFAALGYAVQQARGVDSIIKCVLAIDRLQERRRHLLGMSYGSGSSNKKETIIYPID